MPKRSREDSPTPPPPSNAAPHSESYPSSPASIDTPPQSSRESTDPPIHSNKYIQTSEELPRARATMKCSLPPHNETLAFPTFEEFEIHYAKVHANRCSECRKNFPTEHFLGLHISENHDPLVEVRRAKEEKTYQCFVEGCDKICSTPQKRRMHLTDKHMFPKNYDFQIVNTGIDKRSSMLRTRHRRGSSAASRALYREQQTKKVPSPTLGGGAPDVRESPVSSPEARIPALTSSQNASLKPQHPPVADIDDLTSGMSALKFVPPSVRFGRGGRRGGFSRS